MFRVIQAEIKKILSRPAIYVLALFLAIILILGTVVYKPEQQLKEDEPIISSIATANEKYTYFYNENMKTALDEQLNISVNSVKSYDKTNSKEREIDLKLEIIESKFQDYQAAVLNGSISHDLNNTSIGETRQQLISALEALNLTIEQAKSQYFNGTFVLLTTMNNSEKVYQTYLDTIDWAETIILDETNIGEHFSRFRDDLFPALKKYINNFKYPSLDNATIKSYTENEAGTKLHILKNRLNQILSSIEDIKDNNVTSQLTEKEKANLMDQKINLYKNQIDTYCDLIKYELISCAFKTTNNAEQLNLLFLSEHYSQYNVDSLKIRYAYLFENNKTELDYAEPLTIGVMSNVKTSAFDYAYFVLRFFSFVLIAFAVTVASRTIAGEVQEGTLRFMAIKPLNRRDIYLGKLFAILILSVILLIFSAIIAIAVGGAVYGFESKTILTIFNGTTPIEISPIGMLIIYLFSFIIELTIYLSLTLVLSTVLKMDVLPLAIVLVLYIVNTLLPVFVGNINTWLTYYIFSHTSIYALFGSPVFAPTGYNFFNKILCVKLYTGSNISLTIIICLILISTLNYIGIKLFNRKEL